MRWPRFMCAAVLMAVSGCAQFPELEGQISPAAKAADYPALIPLSPVLEAHQSPPAQRQEAHANTLNARLRALHNRADKLRRANVAAPLKHKLR